MADADNTQITSASPSPKNHNGSRRSRPRAPRFVINIDQQTIDRAVRRDSRNCMIAEAIKDEYPDQMLAYITGPNLPKVDNGAVFYPWVRIPDPLKNGKLRTTAPSGTVAGGFARTDAKRGVWKAPAGTEAVMNNVQAVHYKLTDAENGILNPHAVNCNRLFPVYNTVVWGSRTLAGDELLA